MTKSDIRAKMRHLRQQVTSTKRAAASAMICTRLSARVSPIPSCIAVYLASPDEIDLTPFIDACLAQGVRLAAPRWNGTRYELAELNDCWQNGLVDGPHAIREPPRQARRLKPEEVGIWIVPGLAFTSDGQRLGYGGGWYDRMLEGTKVRKIGVGYRFQLVEALPDEPHDIRMTEVLV